MTGGWRRRRSEEWEEEDGEKAVDDWDWGDDGASSVVSSLVTAVAGVVDAFVVWGPLVDALFDDE